MKLDMPAVLLDGESGDPAEGRPLQMSDAGDEAGGDILPTKPAPPGHTLMLGSFPGVAPRPASMVSPPAQQPPAHAASPPAHPPAHAVQLQLGASAEPARPLHPGTPHLAAGPSQPASVVPGVGVVHGGQLSPAVGLVHGLVSQAGRTHPGDAKVREIAAAAHAHPARYGADLVLAAHAPKHYAERLRTGHLPSHAWAEHESPARLERHLRRVHEEHGHDLARRHRRRPLGERQLIGLAAASGAHEDVVRGLDAHRAHPNYPARTSWPVLMRGLAPHHVARIASEIVPGGSVEPVVETYRALRAEHADRYRLRRRELLRELRAVWVAGAPALVPMFHALTTGMSPEQIDRLRAEIERDGDVESALEQIEAANLETRLASAEAAFRRWLAEYEANRDPAAPTPMDEAHMRPRGPARDASSQAARASGVALSLGDMPEDGAPVESEPEEDAESESEPEADAEPEEAGAARGGGGGRGRSRGGSRRVGGGAGWWGGGGPWWGVEPAGWEFLLEQDDDDDDDEAGAPAFRGTRPAAIAPLRPPAPGAHAADGMLPLGELVQGFGQGGREELARAWDKGAAWDVYNDLLTRRGELARAAREGEFLRRLAGLGCSVPGPCTLDLAQLGNFADLGEHFTPQQWAALTAALTEGAVDPIDAWRQIEGENLDEAKAIRIPAFLRTYGAWGKAARWNPAAWEVQVPRLARALGGDTSGLFDDLSGAIGGLGGGGGDGGGGGLSGLFGGGGGGPSLGQIAGFAGKLGAALPQVVGFAQKAVGQLTGRPQGTPPQGPQGAPPQGAPPGPPPARPPSAPPARRAAPDLHGLDLASTMARWGSNPKSRVHGLGLHLVQALAALGLTDLASAPPREMLRLVPRLLPVPGTDPTTWWRALTAEQHVDREAAEALNAVIKEAGPTGAQQILAAYRAALQPGLDAMKAAREAMFGRILAGAQKAVGAAGFDPHKLPGGSPFALFNLHATHLGDWKAVEDGLRSGQGLAAFRAFEDAREARLLAESAERMKEMLGALWARRGGAAPPAGAGSEAADPEAESPEAGETGWWRGAGRQQRGHDHRALEALHSNRISRRILSQDGDVDGTTLASLRARGEVGDPEEAGDLGDVLGNLFTGGLYGAARFAAQGPAVARAAAFEEGRWDRREGLRGRFGRFGRRGEREREMGDPEASEAGYVRASPVYHLSFNRPMSRVEFGRFLRLVPQLRAHPPGVLREIAGLRSQARDVRGVDARTGEYHLLPGESYRHVAHKLVGDPERWHELHFANPARADDDPVVRIPPGWFGYVNYQIPAHLVHEHIREAGLDAGAPWQRYRERGGHREYGGRREYGGGLGGRHDQGGGRQGRHEQGGRHDGGGAQDMDGQMVRFGNGVNVYLVHRGHHHWVRDPATMNYLGGSAVVQSVDPSTLRTVAGADIPPGWTGGWRGNQPVLGQDAGDDAGEGELDEAGFARRRPSLGRARGAGRHGSQARRDQDNAPDAYAALQDDDAPDDDAGSVVDFFRGIFGGAQPPIAPPIVREPEPPPDDLPLDQLETPTPGKPRPVRADGPRMPTTQRTYTVQAAGEGMWRIAQKLGAASRPHWFGELRDANSHKSIAVDEAGKQLGWAHLKQGETVNVPDLWATKSSTKKAAGEAGDPSAPRRGMLADDTSIHARPGGAVRHHLTAGWPVLVHDREGDWCRVTFLVGPEGGPCEFSDRCTACTGWVRCACVELTGEDEAGLEDDDTGGLRAFSDEELVAYAPAVFSRLGDVAGVAKMLRAVQGTGPTTGFNELQQRILDAINGADKPNSEAVEFTAIYSLLGRDRGVAAGLNVLRGGQAGPSLTHFGRRVLDALTGNLVVAPRPRGSDETGDPTTRRTYTVTAADVANPLDVFARAGVDPTDPAVGAELRAANPGLEGKKPKAGDVLAVPDSWPDRPGMYKTRAATPAAAGAAKPAAKPATTVARPRGPRGIEDALRQNLTKRTYMVMPGDGMQKIAQKLGAASRPHWFAELRDANPHKKSLGKDPATGKDLGFQLDPGKIINVPDLWPDAQELRPPPGGKATARPHQGLDLYPDLPGGMTPAPIAPPGTIAAAATIDPGTWGRVQGILIAFRHAHPDDIDPRDFGAGMPLSPDTFQVPDARTKRALASFQKWANKTAGIRLRTDGILDPETITALDSFHLQVAGEPHQRPAPTPIPGAHMPEPEHPYAPILEGAARPGPRLPETPPAPAPRPSGAPRRPVDPTDPLAVIPGVAGELARVLRDDGFAPPERPAPPAPPRRSREPALQDLPPVIAARGAPGTPSLPGGAPHGPPEGRPPLKVTQETVDRLRREEQERASASAHEVSPPEQSPGPSPKKKKLDGDAAPLLGGALVGGLLGGPLGAVIGLGLGALSSEDKPKPKAPPAPAQGRA